MLTSVNIGITKEEGNMAMIPPGPQIPFSKDRSYGQEPGFVSRNVGKIILGVVVLTILAVVLFMSAIATRGGSDDFGQSSAPASNRR